MKILISGRPATGKTIYAKYLADTRYSYPIYESASFNDFSVLVEKIKNIENCIVVIQHHQSFRANLNFDLHFECMRNIDEFEKFFVKSPTGDEEHLFSDMNKYY
ncbi:hypothetical protein AB7B71_01640 [Acinetobacter nosocomialis]|uniref:hypothetical protein n=1 Tax=Acinetobacter nosocomialis TaxID=106654 RepID=UPI0034E2E126